VLLNIRTSLDPVYSCKKAHAVLCITLSLAVCEVHDILTQ